MARVFFKATEDALNNITEQFKLVHPLRTSMLYTRNAVSQIATETPTADLDVAEVPVVIPPVLGQRLHLNIRGVIGFSDFMQRILIISDINLLQTLAAEDEFISRRPSHNLLTLSANSSRAKAQIGQVCVSAGFLRPNWSEELQRYMVAHRFISR